MNIFMRFPKGKKKALTLSYDDGVKEDVRLIRIMKKYGLKGTFNISSGFYAQEGVDTRNMTKQQATKVYTESGMEVAIHGRTHPFLNQLPENLCINDVIKDRENLEEQFQTIVRGMAYPQGAYSNEVVDCLKCAGIAYARTTISTGDFRIPTDWLRLETTCHHNDPRLMQLAHKFVEEEPKMNRAPWLFYLWGHSYEFEDKYNWNVMEEFAEYMGFRKEIWYATNIEIFEYVEAYRKLVYSLDGHRVFNPTAFTVYFEKDNVLYCVNPGERAVI